MQLNDAIRKLFYTEQTERHLTMPRCEKGNTFPDEGWHDGDDELVNRGLVQEGPDDLASAQGPPAPGRNRGFQAPFAFFFRSAHHFRFASLRRLRVAALIRRRLRFPVV